MLASFRTIANLASTIVGEAFEAHNEYMAAADAKYAKEPPQPVSARARVATGLSARRKWGCAVFLASGPGRAPRRARLGRGPPP